MTRILSLWLARAASSLRESKRSGSSNAGEPDAERKNFPDTYRAEIQSALRQLSPLERSTLRHLRRQGMRRFLGDRHSPVLRSLVRRNLLHPTGSSAFPADAWPYRIPDEVWESLGADVSERADGEPDPV